MNELRVLIVDDHPIVSEGLRLFLESYPDIAIVGTAGDGQEGLSKLRTLNPDCLIVDLALPRLGGPDAIRLYLREQPDLGIVVYSGHAEEIMVYEALQAGARAYVVKGAPVSVLVNALREVHRGGYWLCQELNPTIIKRYLQKPGQNVDAFSEYNTLSSREKQVFLLLAKGRTPREIGETLYISIKTVSKHQAAIRDKLKLKNAAEMAIYALRLGLTMAS